MHSFHGALVIHKWVVMFSSNPYFEATETQYSQQDRVWVVCGCDG